MKFSHTLKTDASPERIWEIWTDVKRWSEWDTELQDSDLEGIFLLGATGQLNPKTGGVSTFKISQFSLGKSYTFTVKLPLCYLNVYRYLTIRSGGTYFTHEVSFDGVLSFIFGLLLGRRFQTVLPSVMENLKRIAETNDKRENKPSELSA